MIMIMRRRRKMTMTIMINDTEGDENCYDDIMMMRTMIRMMMINTLEGLLPFQG